MRTVAREMSETPGYPKALAQLFAYGITRNNETLDYNGMSCIMVFFQE